MTETAVLDARMLDRLTDAYPQPLPGLTPRENEVAELVAQGLLQPRDLRRSPHQRGQRPQHHLHGAGEAEPAW